MYLETGHKNQLNISQWLAFITINSTYRTLVHTPVGADIPEADDILGLEAFRKPQEPRALDFTNWQQ